MRDYLHVDERRLDALVQQFCPPVVYDKVSNWKFGFSLAGPSVEGSQQRAARAQMTSEKVDALLDALQDRNNLARERITDSSFHGPRGNVFRLETCTVVAAVIAPKKADPAFKGLKIWISERDAADAAHLLILLIDFERRDESWLNDHSAYSALLALADEGYDLKQAAERAGVGPFADLKREMQKVEETATIAVRNARRAGKRPPGADDWELIVAEKSAPLLALVEEREQRLRREFSSDPVGTLGWLGARIGAGQKVEVLYRVRAAMNDGPTSIVTIGYPIVAWAAGL
jgi:hypothetical protein